MVIVRWDENLDEVKIFPLVQDTPRFFYQGPMHISGDGNWMKGSRRHRRTEPRIEELVVFHLQDYYPQGISMPVSLGCTNREGKKQVFRPWRARTYGSFRAFAVNFLHSVYAGML
jgi:hypothetical protein